MRAKVLVRRPVESERLFNATQRYDQIDWSDFNAVVRAYRKQLYAWYIIPARVLLKKSGHFSFASLSLNCTLVDTLSQYYYGHKMSRRKLFIRFCRKHYPELKKRFPEPIPIKQGKKIRNLNDGASALYHGIRCGVLHESHPSLFSVISGTGSIVEYKRSGLVEFSRNGKDFNASPAVVFDPGPLLRSTISVLRHYLRELRDPDPKFDGLRKRFKRKFSESFGVRLS